MDTVLTVIGLCAGAMIVLIVLVLALGHPRGERKP